MNQLDFKLERALRIPQLRDAGPLHTILSDPDGNIYYTDPVQSALTAVGCDGKTLWRKETRGFGTGQLWYPTGIGFGLIECNNSFLRCLGVADSWNNRVQFFSLDGAFLAQWDKAGTKSFGEVADIRFIGDLSTGGFWLVLDRGNHRLCGLDAKGEQLFQIGRCLPSTLEVKWHKAGISSGEDPLKEGLVREPLDFDPTFHPQRILGNTSNGLFLWEPTSRSLKQVLLGNLLPVWIDIPSGGEWICADADGLLSWNKTDAVLSYYDASNRSWLSTRIEGIPISAGMHCSEIWIRSEDHLEQRRRIKPDFSTDNASCTAPVLLRSTQGIGQHLSDAVRPAAVEYLQELAERLEQISRRIVKEVVCEDGNLRFFDEQLSDLRKAFFEPVPDIHGSMHKLFLGFLNLRLLQYVWPQARNDETFARSRELLEEVTRPLADSFVRLARCLGDSIHSRVVEDIGRPHQKEKILEVEMLLMKAMDVLSRWSGLLPPCGKVYSLSTAEGAVSSHHWVARPLIAHAGHGSNQIRETDRILLGNPRQPTPVGPACLTHSRDGGILVTLFREGTVLQLDAQGNIKCRLAENVPGFEGFTTPFGVVVDDNGAIWVSETSRHSIKVYDPETRTVRVADTPGAGNDPLCYPHGLCRGAGGSILVADTGNHRILSYGSSGRNGTLCGGFGAGPGEFRYPKMLGSANRNGDIWAVDHGNHRIQRLNQQGIVVGQAGRCGPGRGMFVFPESVAQFDDGVLAVVQITSPKALILLTEDGVEIDRVLLDYDARGMLVHQGRLLIADLSGNHVRVYSRRDVSAS